jgi:eukaryotic-like serine/threonine-protein kinase
MLAGQVTLQDVTEKNARAQLLRLVETEAPDGAVPRCVGRYTLHEKIAFGGMGVVHLCLLQGAAGFRRPVAIKRLHGDPRQRAARDELRQEAWLGSQVRHQNVVPVLDLVEADGKLFLVMEFVLGETLARMDQKNEAMPVAVAVAILSDVLQGLHAAHTATGDSGRPLGIVHRDVSPQNILVGVDGVARILDFGVAKCSAAEARFSETTEAGFFKGKIGYIAPEQLLSESLDARTDIFAAGVVLWEALTGRRLFKGVDPIQTLVRLAEGIAPPSAYNDDVPPSLDAVVARALHRNPQLRFPSAEAFAEQLQNAVPRAPSKRVGKYVEKAAAPAINERRQLLRSIQATGRVIDRQEAARELSLQEATTSAFAIHELLEAPRSGRRGRLWQLGKINVAVGVGALLLASTFYGFWSHARRPQAPPPRALQAPARPDGAEQRAAAPSAPPPLNSATSAAATALNVTEPATQESSSRSPPASTSVPRKGAPVTKTKGAPKRRAVSVSTACRPPYLVDGNGIKRIKRGCL